MAAGVKYGDKSPVLRDINDLETSPFKNLLDWPYNTTELKLVSLTAVEQGLRYLQSLFEMEEDSDSLVELFCAIWRAVRDSYPSIWGKDNKFMKKVNLNALNEFISERIKFAWEMSLVDIFESETVEVQVKSILRLLPEEFWREEWSIKIQDNANVRRLIKSDLETLANNSKMRRPWHENLEIPLQTGVDIDND